MNIKKLILLGCFILSSAPSFGQDASFKQGAAALIQKYLQTCSGQDTITISSDECTYSGLVPHFLGQAFSYAKAEYLGEIYRVRCKYNTNKTINAGVTSADGTFEFFDIPVGPECNGASDTSEITYTFE